MLDSHTRVKPNRSRSMFSYPAIRAPDTIRMLAITRLRLGVCPFVKYITAIVLSKPQRRNAKNLNHVVTVSLVKLCKVKEMTYRGMETALTE